MTDLTQQNIDKAVNCIENLPGYEIVKYDGDKPYQGIWHDTGINYHISAVKMIDDGFIELRLSFKELESKPKGSPFQIEVRIVDQEYQETITTKCCISEIKQDYLDIIVTDSEARYNMRAKLGYPDLEPDDYERE